MFSSLLRDGLDIVVLIVVLCSEGKWEAALQLLELMPSEGVTPDITTFNTALDACVKVGFHMTPASF